MKRTWTTEKRKSRWRPSKNMEMGRIQDIIYTSISNSTLKWLFRVASSGHNGPTEPRQAARRLHLRRSLQTPSRSGNIRFSGEIPGRKNRAVFFSQGADIVGLNCFSGPQIMIRLMREVKKACPGPLACLPVPYRTTETEHTMLSFTLPDTGTYLTYTVMHRKMGMGIIG